MDHSESHAKRVLIAGAIIIAIAMGVRHTFGLFLQPMTLDTGWSRESFALAIALQNLIWGASQPVTGMLADRFGAGKVILGGTVFYVAGLVMMAYPLGEPAFILSAGLLVGLGLSGTTFPIVLGAISRSTTVEKRSMAFGIAMAVGSFGQFIFLPGTLFGLDNLGWSMALIILSIIAAMMIPLAFPLWEGDMMKAHKANPLPGLTAGPAIRQALKHKGFWLLASGFFVCGFQVIFIATHVPAFLTDQGLPPSVGSSVLALIGLFNIAGTYYAGLWGGKRRKPLLLAGIYFARALVIAVFAFLPVTAPSAYAFAIAIGLLWLSTVPLTNGTVASVFGVKNMSMLGGLVFFAHQLGAFLGVWLGGALYDRLGSYDAAWALTIGLSLLATLINLPITETPVDIKKDQEADA